MTCICSRHHIAPCQLDGFSCDSCFFFNNHVLDVRYTRSLRSRQLPAVITRRLHIMYTHTAICASKIFFFQILFFFTVSDCPRSAHSRDIICMSIGCMVIAKIAFEILFMLYVFWTSICSRHLITP